jgi:hypothetical protein
MAPGHVDRNAPNPNNELNSSAKPEAWHGKFKVGLLAPHTVQPAHNSLAIVVTYLMHHP